MSNDVWVCGWVVPGLSDYHIGWRAAVRSCLGGVGSRVPQGRGWHCSVIGFRVISMSSGFQTLFVWIPWAKP